MTPKQQRFVEEYLVDLNASAAARRAGYAVRRADAMGHENLRKPEIAAAIEAARQAQSERTGITADNVLHGLAAIARADARELIEFHRTCCRYCWGDGFRYQRTAGELEQLTRAVGALSETTTPVLAKLAKLAETARQAPVKGLIERA